VFLPFDSYSHAIPAMQEEEAVRIAELAFSEKPRRRPFCERDRAAAQGRPGPLRKESVRLWSDLRQGGYLPSLEYCLGRRARQR